MLKKDRVQTMPGDGVTPYDFTYRIMFSKKGLAKYISHLDLVRTMSRAIRRAGIPIWYTEGFNKIPYMTFAAPLSLGVEGMRESMDLRFVEEVSPEVVKDKLNKVLTQGIEIIEVAEPKMDAKEITQAHYLLNFYDKDKSKKEQLNPELFKKYCNQEEIIVEKLSKKGKLRKLDVTPFAKKAEIYFEEDHYVMDIILPSGGSDNINPALVIESFLAFSEISDKDVFCDIIRLSLLAKDKLFA